MTKTAKLRTAFVGVWIVIGLATQVALYGDGDFGWPETWCNVVAWPIVLLIEGHWLLIIAGAAVVIWLSVVARDIKQALVGQDNTVAGEVSSQ